MIDLQPGSAELQKQEPFCTFFLFVNSGSGGGLGQKLVSQQIRSICFEMPIDSETDVRNIDVHFVNMRKNKESGFFKLRKLTEENKKTISVVCGGDGTVIWVVSEFANFKIDPLKTPLTIIPLGTGNDFSRNLNWGGEKTMLLEHNYRSLKKLIRKWLNAKQQQFDIWDISAEVYQNGLLEKVQNSRNSAFTDKTLSRSFANYFSFGIDGKIGYSFDMHRTSTRVGNLAMYGLLGVIKEATRSKTIDELIESFYIIDETKDDNLIFRSKIKQKTQENKIKDKSQRESTEQKTKYITKGLKNILMLNIDSYTGGVNGIWESAKQIFLDKNYNRITPSSSDGKLQVVSFGSGMAIAMERSFGGFGNRIAQDSGPFIFNFRKYPDEQKHRTYLQIDGQFLRFTHPKKIVVQHSKLIPNGKIKVLRNDPKFQPYIPSSDLF